MTDKNKVKAEDFDLIIESGRTEINYWFDLYRYRELFYILAWRDIKVRYKQTVIGFAWSIIRPLLTMFVFTIIFSKVAKLPSDGTAPYAIMVFAALMPWQFFSNSLSESSQSLVANSNLVSKVYFPRLIIPASSVIVSLVDFLISFVILIGLMAWFQFTPNWHIIYLPIFLVFAFITSMGFGLFITALNVKYRDFRYIIPFIIQIGLYISPVGFSSMVIPEKWRLVYSLNPMVGVIDGFRWSILGGDSKIYLPGFFLSIGIVFIITSLSITYFRKTEKKFADVI
jgi:lipopolysaccharide transport system permease protein